MKADLCYKTVELDITYDDVKQAVRDKLEPGYDFKINSYRVTLDWHTAESTVYVQYTEFPERRLINVGNLNVSNDLYEALEKDNKGFHKPGNPPFNDVIINALENYYEV